VVGLGCGGHSRLGISQGNGDRHATRIVKYALDLGINFIDTARVYGTETVVGDAIKGCRDKIVISTKSLIYKGGDLLSKEAVVESLEKSLVRLQTDTIDVFSFHGVRANHYLHCVREILPALVKQQELGKIRFIGITEAFALDPSHEMLKLALQDDYFDVVMVGFNMLNQSARHTVFPLTIKNNVATQIMFAVRRALSQKQALVEVVEKLIKNGDIEESLVRKDAPLDFVENHADIISVVQAAYRFCRHEAGATVVFTGTGSEDHLRENVDSILAGPLPPEVVTKLNALFGRVDSVSGD